MRILLCHPGHSFSTSDVFDGLLTGLTAAGADVVTFRWDQIMQRLGAFVAGLPSRYEAVAARASRVLVRRETPEDLLALDAGLDG